MLSEEKKTWYVTVQRWNNKTGTKFTKSYVCDESWKAKMLYDLLLKVFGTLVEFEGDWRMMRNEYDLICSKYDLIQFRKLLKYGFFLDDEEVEKTMDFIWELRRKKIEGD